MFNFQLPPARRTADVELVREDVFQAVSGAQAYLESTNPILRGISANGSMDARFTSAPVNVMATSNKWSAL